MSITLPCFKALAGLKGPSKSSVLLLVVDLTAAVLGMANFPFEMEGPNFATGALKVNPAEGEKEDGLAAVALTMGEENVNGTEGGVEAFGGSLLVSDSLDGVVAVILEVELMEAVVVRGGSGDEKLNEGRADVLIGSGIVGRSGASATSSISWCLVEGRVVVLSRFILPPPDAALLLAAGVLDSG